MVSTTRRARRLSSASTALLRVLMPVLVGALAVGWAGSLVGLTPQAHAGEDALTSQLTGHLSGELTLQVSLGAAASGTAVPVDVSVQSAEGPAADVPVRIQRWTAGQEWADLVWGATDAAGQVSASLVLLRDPEQNRVRTRVEGASPGAWVEHQAALIAHPSAVSLSAPASVADEQQISISTTWSTAAGEPVAGTVVLQRRVLRGGRWGSWGTFATLATDTRGMATFRARPRHTHQWRIQTEGQPWVVGAASPVVTTRNAPAMSPVRLPRGAPKPRITLPQQRRAVGAGANVVIRGISDARWRSMKGVSWRRGCPVGRSGLRLVETNYWAFDGYRRRGAVVVNASVVDNFRGAFVDLHRAQVPIRSLRPAERFGRSSRLAGADDMRSMAAGNSSAFNCRVVVGKPGSASPHAWGRSFDLNPWENPFRSAWGVVPNRWWLARGHRDVAWRTAQHRVLKLLGRNGFRWTYGHGDLHHFDAVGRPARTGR